MPKVTDHPLSEALQSWTACNDFLREANEQEALALLQMERKGKKRLNYLLRIHNRYNSQRGKREKHELVASTNG